MPITQEARTSGIFVVKRNCEGLMAMVELLGIVRKLGIKAKIKNSFLRH